MCSRLLATSLLFILVGKASAYGTFQFRLLSYYNEHGKDHSGLCCNDFSQLTSSEACPVNCESFFRICLKQYQHTIDPAPPCTYGSRHTGAYGNRLINFDQSELMEFPFSFAWPGTFSLIVEAWHNTTGEDAQKQLLIRIAEAKSLAVGQEWTEEEYKNGHSTLKLQYRVVCQDNYYGPQCMSFCKPKDDLYAHFACNEDGKQVCLPGWTGSRCDKAICAAGCRHGTCSRPNECECTTGWQGDLCDKCVEYPGCKHGTCYDKPWTCECKEGWGGQFCNQDLNFCTHHEPCQNGATCTNTGSGHYTCTCQPGFTGTNCELQIQDCTLEPCLNGGTCREFGSNFTCACRPGYNGRHCQIMAQHCSDSPCLNGGSCRDTYNGFVCLCPPGWEGANCDIQKNECSSSPCRNGGGCISEFNGFQCKCPIGFRGKTCEENENDCGKSPCLNGGHCIDEVNNFKCNCPPEFYGSLCQSKYDNCIARPCANGGTCFDHPNDFKCLCRPGFTGKRCSVDINECAENPCRNGATCDDIIDDYICRCPPCYTGKNCDVRHDDCLWPITFKPNLFGSQNLTTAQPPAAVPPPAEDSTQGILIGVTVSFTIVILVLVVLLLLFGCKHYRHKFFRGDIERQQNERNISIAAKSLPANNRIFNPPISSNIQPFDTTDMFSPIRSEQERKANLKAKRIEEDFHQIPDPSYSVRPTKVLTHPKISNELREKLETKKLTEKLPLAFQPEFSTDSGLGSTFESDEIDSPKKGPLHHIHSNHHRKPKTLDSSAPSRVSVPSGDGSTRESPSRTLSGGDSGSKAGREQSRRDLTRGQSSDSNAEVSTRV